MLYRIPKEGFEDLGWDQARGGGGRPPRPKLHEQVRADRGTTRAAQTRLDRRQRPQ